MLSEDEEYDQTGDEEEFKFNESEGRASQAQFLLGKKRKIIYEELNVSTEPSPLLPQNYEPRDFRRLTQSNGKGHLSTSVATTSRLNATNLMSLFDCKVGNGDNQVIVSMVERWWATTHTFHLPCGQSGITPKDFTVHTEIGVLFGNSRSWARLELLGSILLIEKKGLMIDFGSAILGDLYYCLDQASKQEVKYIGGFFQLIEYQCYEYCQIGYHILIDNRNMKDVLKRKIIIASNISRKRVLLQSPFVGYEWYLGDRCWAQLEYRAVPYDPPKKIHCFPSPDVVRSLRATG
ncbi:hypothetical protein GIB67_003950 [Kingdonia uniflora]|uniref:Aminotransferase-like plant mobile domain-containing protein n=1 Tax=Kingdonia uniflora TaxID=39325 RepID=A0A7J7P8R2_9MAGN|nr:hypothetical protein GIB67_003950 [Kingdonia uniflora]